MPSLADLKVGDRVTIWPGSYELQVPTFTTVAAVGKLKLTTADGRQWKKSDGYRWGSKFETWSVPVHIEPFDPKHEEVAATNGLKKKRLWLLHAVSNASLGDQPLEVLERIAAILGITL